jgi:hypothetical protein
MKTNLFRKNYSSSRWGMRIMRLALLLLPLLGRGLGGGGVLFAQGNGVKVSNLSVGAGTVTFNVSWNRDAMPVDVWSDTVWVFVDYNNNGKMERLPVTGATLTATSAPGMGKVVEDAGNNQGVWVVGNARSADVFSATVQLFTTVKDVSGACVYGSNYPPVMEYTSASEISFTGTPPYELLLAKAGSPGETEQVESGNKFLLPCDYTLTSFTDATGAPGTFHCIPSTAYTLVASASTFCAGGAGVTFALLWTDDGNSYQLYRDGTAVGALLEGKGSPATFSDAFNVAGTYSARTIPDGTFCPAEMNGSLPVVSNPLPGTPTMSGGGTYCSGAAIITATAGSGDGIRWDDGSTAPERIVTASGTYYAVTTSAAVCTSSTAMVSVTIGMPGSAGAPVSTTCGCAAELTECDGMCSAVCSLFTDCGITDISRNTYEGSGFMTFASAKDLCAKKGADWRLPTIDELHCICKYADTMPGAPHPATGGEYYWTTSLYNSTYLIMQVGNCWVVDRSPSTRYLTKCVK